MRADGRTGCIWSRWAYPISIVGGLILTALAGVYAETLVITPDLPVAERSAIRFIIYIMVPLSAPGIVKRARRNDLEWERRRDEETLSRVAVGEPEPDEEDLRDA